ncbi:MAG: protein kinase [Myxococcota bacterium]
MREERRTRDERGGVDATQATLLLAAKQAVSATAGTVLDVLRERAFGHYAEGLRQYLSIRLGDGARGSAAWTKLRDRALALSDEALSESPGVRARLYRMAREIAEEAAPAPTSTGTLLWYRPRTPSESRRTAVLRIREEAADPELLELRYARELRPDEIAFVLELDAEEVKTRLESAVESARKLAPKERSRLPRALLEAFALERLEAEVASVGGDDGRLPEDTIVGERYCLKRHIGAGAFADVYRAEDVEVPGHVLALKMLRKPSSSPEHRQQALKELRIIAAVYHPSIVQFKDYGWYDDRLWFAMPWYDGDVLESRMADEAMTRRQARAVFVPLARALATMHAAGIRHQDIKPDNIFLADLRGFEEDGEHGTLPVLLDLGVAAKDAELVLAGTPTYFAPEVAAQFAYREGDPFPSRPIGPAADVFALALSLRNALEPETQPDVAAGAVESFIRSRAENDVPLFTRPDLVYLNRTLERWLSPEPDDRPTADEFADELAVLTEPEERRERRLGYLKLFGPLAVAAAVIFGVVVYELRSRAEAVEEKAALAESEAAAARADLEDEASRREELESQVGEAEARIRAQHLSESELEASLAQAEGSLSVAQRRLTSTRRNLTERTKALEQANENLASTQASLEVAQSEVASLQGDLRQTRASLEERGQQLAQREQALAEAQGDLRQLRGQLAEAQQASERASAAERSAREALRQAEARATAAEAQAQRAERAQASAEARVRELERAASRRPAPSPVSPAPTNPSPATTMRGRRAPGTR